MARKIFFILGLVFFLSVFLADLKAEEGGYALLDKFILTFRQMAESGTGGRDKVFPAMDGMMTEAKQAKAQGKIEPVFYHRFTRILRVCKLSIIEDPAGTLAPLIDREIGAFIEDVKGEEVDNASNKNNIGLFADAIAEELINLKMYLDGQKEKARLKDEFMMNKFNTTAPVKKK